MGVRMVLLFIVIFLMMLVAACETKPGADQTPQPERPTSQPQGLEEQARAAVRSYLSGQGQLPAGTDQGQQPRVVSAQPVLWRDTCLELGQPDESCAQIQTPGWSMVVKVDSVTYTVRVSQDGTQMRFQDPEAARQVSATSISPTGESGTMTLLNPAPAPKRPINEIPATGETRTPAGALSGPYGNIARKVVKEAVAQLNFPEAAIQVISVLPASWPNSCLGLAQPGMNCLDVITPGFQVVVEINGVYYEARTNRGASSIRIGSGVRPAPNSRPGAPVIPPPSGTSDQ